jgi:hypothetical protein
MNKSGGLFATIGVLKATGFATAQIGKTTSLKTVIR